jgi:histidinol dehydrogenase
MIKRLQYDRQNKTEILDRLNSRSGEADPQVVASVEKILQKVQNEGDQAVRYFTRQFDGIELDEFIVTKEQIEEGYRSTSPELIAAMEQAAANIREFHEHQKQKSWLIEQHKGNIMMGQQIRALKRVGVYVPGGTAAYPSSVLMNVIPAQVAGVEEIIMVTPPSKDGTLNRHILAAAHLVGVSKIYAIGGAQAVAALAYGTETIEKVDKIVGPGNIFVATAKRLLFGRVDIDMIAGPSEILIVADNRAKPKYIAADMMSQAEHDPLASSILVCLGDELADGVIRELKKQIKEMGRKEIIQKSLEDFGAIIVCEKLEDAIDLANEIAPEHLELMIENPLDHMDQIKNAGSIFLGDYCPEPLGDYFAGPNHVLPTSGTARFFSPLSVDSFVKKSSFIYYSKDALSKAREHVTTFATSEGLGAHANSIEVRFKR